MNAIPEEIAELSERIIEYHAPSIGYVYFLICGNDVVYVGQTVSLASRIPYHQSDAEKQFDRVLYLEVARNEMDEVERAWIERLKPQFNIEYTGKPYTYKSKLAPLTKECNDARRACMPGSVFTLPISDRYCSRLYMAGVESAAAALALPDIDIISTPGIGIRGLQHIRQAKSEKKNDPQ